MPITGTYIDIPFATAGVVTTVPDAVQSNGSISFEQGYGPNYSLPQSNPSVLNPDSGTMNYLFYLLTTIAQQWQQFTTAPWITHAENGGSAFSYALYARVLYTDGHIYESLVATNTTDPVNDGIHWKIVDASATRSSRTLLTTNTIYYVSTTGNDSTGTGASGNPWLTVQHAINYIQENIDLGGFNATIQLADGTYTNTVSSGSSWVGGNEENVIINGNSVTPSNVVISVTSNVAFVSTNTSAGYTIQNLKVQTTTSGAAILAQAGARIIIGSGIVFGACASAHIDVNDGGGVFISNSYTISGSASYHLIAGINGTINHVPGITVTLSGTPGFSNQFATTSVNSSINAVGITYSGSATGVRYSAISNGVINTNGAGANYFPGNSAGSTATGGQYV